MGKKLDIVSLGPGGMDDLTVRARRILLRARVIYGRLSGPVLACLERRHGKTVRCFAHLYRHPLLGRRSDRRLLYRTMASVVVEEALKASGVVYALPGSAVMMEQTTYLIHELAASRGLEVRTTLGVSFVDAVLASLPAEFRKHTLGQFVVTAANLDLKFDPRFSYLIAQAPDALAGYGADGIRKILARNFPADHAFLLLYPQEDSRRHDCRTRVVPFRARDLGKRRVRSLLRKPATLFLPAPRMDFETMMKRAPRR